MAKRLLVLTMWAATLAAVASLAQDTPAPRPLVFRTQTMGTWGSVTIVTADSAAVADAAYDALVAFHRVDSLMSNWTETSEIARVNREGERGAKRVDAEVLRVIAFAQTVSRESDGAFDVTVEPLVRAWGFLGGTPKVPSRMEIDAALSRVGYDKVRIDEKSRTVRLRDYVRVDLGGIAKGYGVDEAAKVLRAAGISDALVDLSGNMAAVGNAVGHEGWTVGIRDPKGKHPYLARLNLQNECVATSGDYQQFVDKDGTRYGHIIDPRTGTSARGLLSVTVVAKDAMACDAWATALFVLGPERARELAKSRDDLSVVLIEPQDNGPSIIWVEESLESRFQIADELESALSVRTF